ncbi:MAG: glycosyltransferase family 2 protein [Candidatus Liptonbacteria bacterium]|nr:glycosyltransferase family 2 protein [Candidatus Liptonbacteria bacterium]
MSQEPYLSVVIPAYNEAERIPLTLIDIDRHLSSAPYTYEILVVNDGSRDKTAEVVRGMAATIKNLKLVDNARNQGKGGVVRQGMLLAKGQVRIFTDADNSTSIDQFAQMIPFFSSGRTSPEAMPAARGGSSSGGQGYQVVIGSRAIRGASLDPPQPLYRQIPGKIGNLLIQILLLPGLWDTQCGFKAFTAEAAEKVFTLSQIHGWAFDVEVLALAKRLGYRIKEVPVHWVNNLLSRVTAMSYLKFLLETFKIRWWFWTSHYDLGADSKPSLP